MRTILLIVALLFIFLMATATIAVTARHGITILTFVALFVLALFAFGIVGALVEMRRD